MSRALLAVEMWKKCSTCRSQNGTKTTCSDHFWKLRCSKSARRCGVKHIFSQNEKAHHVRTTFGRSNGTTQHNNKQKRKIQQQQPTTNNQQPTTNNQQPTTNNQQPTTDNRQPTTNNQQPTTNNQQPTTNNQQPTTNPLKKAQLQPPFGPSVDSLCLPCITATHLSHCFLSLKLPPPPCAVLLVSYSVKSDLSTRCCVI